MLAAAIESVQAQTYHRWEMVVVDDGGDDRQVGRRRDRRRPRAGAARSRTAGRAGARNVGLDGRHGQRHHLPRRRQPPRPWLAEGGGMGVPDTTPSTEVLYGARLIDDHRPGARARATAAGPGCSSTSSTATASSRGTWPTWVCWPTSRACPRRASTSACWSSATGTSSSPSPSTARRWSSPPIALHYHTDGDGQGPRLSGRPPGRRRRWCWRSGRPAEPPGRPGSRRRMTRPRPAPSRSRAPRPT